MMATSATILAFRLSDSTRSPIATLAQSRTRSVNRHQYPAVNHTYSSGDDVFITQALPETLSLALIYGCGGGLLEFSAEENGNDLDGDFGGSDGSILPPPPSQMLPDEGFALREWRRLNAMRLEEKSRIFKP